ncbi:MAG: aspartate phosphatase [Chromatiales bacterium]|nr:aspartate phosphatase [Chromatiales bacterium]
MSDTPRKQNTFKRQPVVSRGLRRLLFVVFGLFGLLAVNGIYLAAVTSLETATGEVYQDYLYQILFLVHLLLGLALLLPAVLFGGLHLRRAWRRPNRAAVRAGLALYLVALVLLFSGLALTRFDFFEIREPWIRSGAYWLHVVTPLLAIWLFILHRLAGPPIHWKVGVGWAAVAGVFTLAMVFVQAPDAGTETLDAASYRGDVFRPALAKTDDGDLIPARALMMDGYCQECHADVHEQWSASAHRFSSFNNPAYRFSVRETRKVALEQAGDTRASRFCAGCHDPVPLFSGAFDDAGFDDQKHPTATAGVTCSVCHAIERIDSRSGNADYTIAEPAHYPFAYSDNPVLAWVNRQLVKAKPAFHKKTFLKPLHRGPEFCGTCHKVALTEAVNHYKWLRGQNHLDSFRLSGVSGHGASSFYYPPRAVETCANCHMPLRPSEDFGADHFAGAAELSVHDHQFPAANTALAHWMGLPDRVNEKHRRMLAGALRVDLFGLKRGGTIDGELLAPLDMALPSLEPGQRYLLEVVLRTLKPGHWFTQGTSDSNEVWLEVLVRSGDRIIGHSGAEGPEGDVDPWAHFVNSYVLDRQGRRIDRRNAQDIFTSLYNHQIPPGAADVVHYGFTVPASVKGPVTLEARLHYRKFDTTYLRYIQGDDFKRNDLPVVTIAEARLELPVGDKTPVEAGSPSPVSAWERWNDYGIALLRKGARGELRQAAEAFSQVESLGRADGPLNLARVYLREGRLSDAADALRRAVAHQELQYPWVAAWLSAQVDKQNANLDSAIASYRRIIDTDFDEARRRGFDFSEDFRVLNELGQTLVERSKQERGAARQEERRKLLEEARGWFEKTLAIDPENTTAHYNLALVYRWLEQPELAQTHRLLYGKYRPDDNAVELAVTRHRRENPAADHAAEAVVVYELAEPPFGRGEMVQR